MTGGRHGGGAELRWDCGAYLSESSGTSVAPSLNYRVNTFQEVHMLFFVALGMAAVGLGWVAVRRKRKAAEEATTDR